MYIIYIYNFTSKQHCILVISNSCCLIKLSNVKKRCAFMTLVMSDLSSDTWTCHMGKLTLKILTTVSIPDKHFMLITC